MSRRALSELINEQEPAWSLVESWVADASNDVVVLPPSSDAAIALQNAQVTTRSPLGAVIYQSGGLLVDSGWVRVLGSGHPRLPRRIDTWNEGRTLANDQPIRRFYLVADDVVGGFFAINGGDLGEKTGEVCYYAPDSLAWESLEMGYSDFLRWCCVGDLAKYYDSCRWANWRDEVKGLTGDAALFIYPPLFTTGPPLSERRRGVVPVHELFSLYVDEFPRQLGET